MYNDQNSKQIAIGMLIANLRATLKDKVNSHQLAVYESWATNVDDMRHHESYCEVSRFFDGIIFIICYVLTFISVQVLIDKEEEGIPPLIYLCRQKHLKSKHYYKAGNMNALVSLSLSLSLSHTHTHTHQVLHVMKTLGWYKTYLIQNSLDPAPTKWWFQR